MAKEKSVSKKVSLYPQQLNKIKSVADTDYEGNESMALRKIVDAHNEEQEHIRMCQYCSNDFPTKDIKVNLCVECREKLNVN